MKSISRLAALRTQGSAVRAKQLRSQLTDAERKLWYNIRARRFQGIKFRRQVPLGPFIVDFLCDRARLVIELDGGQHGERKTSDALRTQWLESQGYSVIRYWNNEVLNNIEGVLENLSATLSPALSQGRGGKT
jgi:very-short-patch-repair endonuclease